MSTAWADALKKLSSSLLTVPARRLSQCSALPACWRFQCSVFSSLLAVPAADFQLADCSLLIGPYLEISILQMPIQSTSYLGCVLSRAVSSIEMVIGASLWCSSRLQSLLPISSLPSGIQCVEHDSTHCHYSKIIFRVWPRKTANDTQIISSVFLMVVQ